MKKIEELSQVFRDTDSRRRLSIAPNALIADEHYHCLKALRALLQERRNPCQWSNGMTFQPIISGSGLGAWIMLKRTYTDQLCSFEFRVIAREGQRAEDTLATIVR